MKPKILIVEDESIVARDIEMSLKNLGYGTAGIATSGESAIKKVEEHRPDLVLMDIVLGGRMNGVEAAAEIRSRFNIPVVYLTAYADEKTLKRAKITQPFGYVTKPFEDKDLRVVIEIALFRTKAEAERKRTEEELRSSREQLRQLSVHLQSIREEERKAIASEIHDDLGQVLTAIKMELSWLAKRLPEGPKPLFERLKSVSELTDSAIQTLKRISAELRPAMLDDLGLSAAIEWQAEEYKKHTGIDCKYSSRPGDIFLGQDHSIALFRICQELLTNAARHTAATEVKIFLRQTAKEAELKVKDNGRGITEEQISSPRSFGLIGMRERARSLGGDIEVSGVPGRGTTVLVTIPLDKEGEA